jgi:hypothetical protein
LCFSSRQQLRWVFAVGLLEDMQVERDIYVCESISLWFRSSLIHHPSRIFPDTWALFGFTFDELRAEMSDMEDTEIPTPVRNMVLPDCDCDVYMPPGQHDPWRHPPAELAAIAQANEDAANAENARVKKKREVDQLRVRERLAAAENLTNLLPPPAGPNEKKVKQLRRRERLAATANSNNLLPPAAGPNELCDFAHALEYASDGYVSCPPLFGVRPLVVADSVRLHSAHFTCGGRIPVAAKLNKDDVGRLTPRSSAKLQEGLVLEKGIGVRWGAGELLDWSDQSSMERFLAAFQPATFGRKSLSRVCES